MTNEELIKIAIEAKNNSYSPYSHYKVGAALLTKDGRVFKGTNVENCGYTPANCAERSAFFSAISNGAKRGGFAKIAIVGDSEGIAYPCGVCRQVIVELAPDIEIICAKDETYYEVKSIQDLLPNAFTPDDL